jgi:Protein of unknown function (DUF2934)
VFSQVYAPYYLAADFTVRLQREMLMQWFKGWSRAVGAVFGTGRVQTADEREPLSSNGRGEDADGQSAVPTRTAGSGRESRTIALEESILRRAYFKWVDEGCPDGHHLRHYFEAQHEVRA